MRRRLATRRSGNTPSTKLRLIVVTAVVTTLANLVTVAAVGALGSVGSRLWEAVRDDEPVRVVVVLERDQQIQGEMWVFPQAISPTAQDTQLLAEASDRIEEFRDWARQNNAADAEITVLKLVIEGVDADTVRVIGIRARLDQSRAAPLTGTLLFAGTAAGADITEIGFDLDENDPVARTVSKNPDPRAEDYFGPPYFSTQQTKTLQRGEQEVFQITARTLKHYVEWHIEVTLLVDGQEQTIDARPAGRSIRTTALNQTASQDPYVDTINYAAYQKLYVWDFSRLPNGFLQQDPGTYSGDR
jgi:hypothetical protein